MVFRRIRFPYVHDLDKLLSVLVEAGEVIPNEIEPTKKLTPFAIEARYPSVAKEVTEEEHAEAIEIAEAVVRWAEQIVLGGNPPSDTLA